MEYKKKYEKLVDAVKVLRDNNPSDEGIQNWVNDNIPELKESGVKRIKTAILNHLKKMWGNSQDDVCGVRVEDAIEWLENVGKDKEINNFNVLPGYYKCVHRMFDGTPDGKLLFEVGNIYKCLSKHSRAEFEVSYGHSVYLEDPVVCKHFIPFEKQSKEEYVLKSFKDEDVRKFMQYIEKQAKAYEFNLPNRSYDIYAFAKDILIWLEKQGNKPQGKSALEAIREEKVDNANKIEPKDYSSIDPYFGKPIDKVGL